MYNLKYSAFAAFALVALAIPTFTGCKKGENDPGISVKSRDSRISGVWKLTGGSIAINESSKSELKFDNSDCDEVIAEDFSADFSNNETYTFADGSFGWTEVSETSDDIWYYSGGSSFQSWDRDDYADQKNNSVTGISSNTTLTIRTDGTFKLDVDLSYREADFPHRVDQDGDMQFGQTFTKSVSIDGDWWWADNGKSKSGITFSDWVLPFINTSWYYDEFDGNGNPIHKFNYITDMGYNRFYESVTMNVDMLKNKELTLMSESVGTENSLETTDRFEGLSTAPTPAWEDCVTDWTMNTTETTTIKYMFTGDGKNVDGEGGE